MSAVAAGIEGTQKRVLTVKEEFGVYTVIDPEGRAGMGRTLQGALLKLAAESGRTETLKVSDLVAFGNVFEALAGPKKESKR